MGNRVCELFGIKYPIIQGGMVWVSGAKLAAAVSNSGGLGLIGAGSMKPDLLREHIKKAKNLTDKPFGVNIPIFSKYSEDQVKVALEEGVKIFFMSAGSPKKFTPVLKENGCIVAHVASTPTLAKKCEDAGVDAVVVEGFEAGGHNGRDELTTFVLIPQAKKIVSIPLIAAGGIATGSAIVAAFALGAEGVQIGTRFAATKESSAHENYKKAIVNAKDTDTMLYLKSIIPVRLVKNSLTVKIEELEKRCADVEEFKKILGEHAAKRAIFDGDVDNGEIEAGQIAGLIDDIPSVSEVFDNLIKEFNETVERFKSTDFFC
ncbi:enoyl-[acyl-carrier protein] reductase II [Thermotomaculum hydrothermale]|uniref:Enoyl-[acyl-carrier protein] reductase II n=1 Tax=Thermotomaculum hydrothermale TaxID=981385 RepID=A0A7R6PLX8_9BACT|nr:nitronate monooxygenase [Thermotomaculum hydrothermale]BBB32527.1 enoyl-[acyl-carrier protein] reductase II [Thermotomaculum hydrothermale]